MAASRTRRARALLDFAWRRRPLAAVVLSVVVVSCSGNGDEPKTAVAPPAPAARGGYYLDDGPGDNPPDIGRLADATPQLEPLSRSANQPYVVFGKEYVPERRLRPFRQRGIASWYGRRFHGGRTANGDVYDMYAMTAAHPTLPIPSYARVTNLANGRAIVVRVNDRGPFLHGRIIDVSYAAAYKLGFAEAGATMVDVQSVLPDRAETLDVPRDEKALATDASRRSDMVVRADASGIYLQLAAFAAPESAENLRARMTLELGWLTQPLVVVPGDGLYRLRMGPFARRADAATVAARIQETIAVAPVIVGK